METYHYVDQAGQQVGPISRPDMIKQIRAGVVQQDSMILREGDPGWKSAFAYEDLWKEGVNGAGAAGSPTPQQGYESPTIASAFNVLGGLAVAGALGAAVMLAGRSDQVPLALSFLVSAIFMFGAAAALDFLARINFNLRKIVRRLEDSQR